MVGTQKKLDALRVLFPIQSNNFFPSFVGCRVLDLGITTKIGGEERRREVRYGETKHSYVSGRFGFRRRFSKLCHVTDF